MIGSPADFARHLGVARSTISRAIKAGRIATTPEGKIDFETALAAWHAGAGGRPDVSARHAANRGAAIPSQRPAKENAATGRESAETGLGTPLAAPSGEGRTQAKALAMQYENNLIKLEMALRRGLRFERGAVKREAASLGALIRAGIERVIDQTAPRLAAAGNDIDRRRILEAEVGRLRRVVRREMPRALRRMKEAGASASVAKVGSGADQ